MKWSFNWKRLFNPDPNKPVQAVLFSWKKKTSIHPVVSPNDIQVEKSSYQKHFDVFLDEKITFKHHIDHTPFKVNRDIEVIKN